ncbi:triose-phosphate isomerase [Bremerella alba]|nr:triose-phosphate isomerase [Bremerella alba]
MRRPFIAGNWKMNTTKADGVALVQGVADGNTAGDAVEVAVCAPSVYLDAVATAAGGKVGVGAQNCHHEATGAFTGEISAAMAKDIGCQYVILGHSERRHIFGESNADVCKKVHAVLAAGLTPIVCVGELLEERESGKTSDVVAEQMYGSLAGVSAEQMNSVVIAYEPVWAIGTGKVATPEQAEEVHAGIRSLMTAKYGEQVSESVRIQYGGSVKPDNAVELLSQPNIDGALVGGASLKADSFLGIIAGTKG